MRFFLDKLASLFNSRIPDATIVGSFKLRDGVVPYFTVKMRGCPTLVDINAEEIVEKYTNKFSQVDIKNATKILMKYRVSLRLVSIEKNFAILFESRSNAYKLIDLSDNQLLSNVEIESLRAEDAFKLGVHFEMLRRGKDKKIINLTKSGKHVTKLTLVESDAK